MLKNVLEKAPLIGKFAQLERHRKHQFLRWLVPLLLVGVTTLLLFWRPVPLVISSDDWYRNIVSPTVLCENVPKPPKMFTGYIGLDGDTPISPKRSFFWLFEAENQPENAPVVLVTAGGPGTSALVHALYGQSSCKLEGANGLVYNPWRWTEHFNMLFIDHPVGTGFSYGSLVNNSYSAALDVYDFLQKFYTLFPTYSRNKLVLSSGSYGGIFMPHIANLIMKYNESPRRSKDKKIILDSIMLTNPVLNVEAHFLHMLDYRCQEKQVYENETCNASYQNLPECLERIRMATVLTNVERRISAFDYCYKNIASGDTNNTLLEDVRKKCFATPTPTNPGVCHPQFEEINKYLNDPEVKGKLGVPPELKYRSLSIPVNQEFYKTGDMIAKHHLLLERLLQKGVRLLVYVGAQDANCAWPGVISSLNRLRTSFQEQFLNAEERVWNPLNSPELCARVRSVGSGAGNLTYILINDAGHFVIKDNPAIAKLISEHWIFNKTFHS